MLTTGELREPGGHPPQECPTHCRETKRAKPSSGHLPLGEGTEACSTLVLFPANLQAKVTMEKKKV